jgi:hypothetical protein
VKVAHAHDQGVENPKVMLVVCIARGSDREKEKVNFGRKIYALFIPTSTDEGQWCTRHRQEVFMSQIRLTTTG